MAIRLRICERVMRLAINDKGVRPLGTPNSIRACSIWLNRRSVRRLKMVPNSFR